MSTFEPATEMKSCPTEGRAKSQCLRALHRDQRRADQECWDQAPEDKSHVGPPPGPRIGRRWRPGYVPSGRIQAPIGHTLSGRGRFSKLPQAGPSRYVERRALSEREFRRGIKEGDYEASGDDWIGEPRTGGGLGGGLV